MSPLVLAKMSSSSSLFSEASSGSPHNLFISSRTRKKSSSLFLDVGVEAVAVAIEKNSRQIASSQKNSSSDFDEKFLQNSRQIDSRQQNLLRNRQKSHQILASYGSEIATKFSWNRPELAKSRQIDSSQQNWLQKSTKILAILQNLRPKLTVLRPWHCTSSRPMRDWLLSSSQTVADGGSAAEFRAEGCLTSATINVSLYRSSSPAAGEAPKRVGRTQLQCVTVRNFYMCHTCRKNSNSCTLAVGFRDLYDYCWKSRPVSKVEVAEFYWKSTILSLSRYFV